MQKKRKIEKVFGNEESKWYSIKRNTFFTILTVLFVIGFFLRRYLSAFTGLKYIQYINAASFLGLIVVVATFHLGDRMFSLSLRKRDYIFVYLMSITGIIFSALYFRYAIYDKIEHLFFPMMFASITFYILTRKLKISLGWRLFLTFFIIVGFLSLFEVWEYFLDLGFNWKMQGVFQITETGEYIETLGRIDDTMIDIGLGILGTLIYTLSVLFIEKKKLKQKH